MPLEDPSAAMPRIDPQWAWTAYQPGGRRPWDLKLAGHLYRRAGFGATWAELQKALIDGPQKTVDRLLVPAGDPTAFNRQLDELESASDSVEGLRAWCKERMAAYKVPRAVEFVDALPKSGSGKVMWRLLQEQENAGA